MPALCYLIVDVGFERNGSGATQWFVSSIYISSSIIRRNSPSSIDGANLSSLGVLANTLSSELSVSSVGTPR